MKADICIVDDNQEYLETVAQLFKHSGYDVNTIPDPQNALECIRQQNPDLVILDIMMPNIDGFSLLKGIKDDSQLNHIPVIIVSGKVFPPERKRAFALGASTYLAKPISSEELLMAVSELIGKN